MREEETERAWWDVRGTLLSLILDIELERFRAEAGCGMAEL